MTTVTRSMGPAPGAIVVVPLVGAFSINLANAIVLNLMSFGIRRKRKTSQTANQSQQATFQPISA